MNIESFFGKFQKLWIFNIMRIFTTISIASFYKIGCSTKL
jgi:hypothetical protein